MMQEAEDQHVLHTEDPTIATQLQEAAQTNVTARNGSSQSPATSQLPPLMQASSPLPAFVTGSPNSPSATIPSTTTTVPSPLSKIPSMPPSPSQFASPLPQFPSQGMNVTSPSNVTPMSTVPATTTTQITAPVAVESPREALVSVPVPLMELEEDTQGGGGILGWGKGIMNKMVEKTKSSVESVITTLDPGMKELILSGGDIDIIVTSTKETKVSPVREAFQQVFGKATITGQESSANTAAQPLGFTAGLKGAEERIQNLRHGGTIHEKQPVISVEGFIAELLPDRWYELSCLVLQDPGYNINLETFSQPTLIPPSIIQRMQDATTADYPMRWSGLAMTVGQAVEESMTGVSRTEWQEALSGVKRRDSLYLAVKGLAEMYKLRLPVDQST